MTLTIELLQLLTPAAQEEIEDKLVAFFNSLGIEARIENSETGNISNTLNAEDILERHFNRLIHKRHS